MPDEMYMVGHDDKTINSYSFLTSQEIEAGSDNMLVFIWLEQMLPLEDGGGEEMRIIGFKKFHGWKLLKTSVISRRKTSLKCGIFLLNANRFLFLRFFQQY